MLHLDGDGRGSSWSRQTSHKTTTEFRQEGVVAQNKTGGSGS